MLMAASSKLPTNAFPLTVAPVPPPPLKKNPAAPAELLNSWLGFWTVLSVRLTLLPKIVAALLSPSNVELLTVSVLPIEKGGRSVGLVGRASQVEPVDAAADAPEGDRRSAAAVHVASPRVCDWKVSTLPVSSTFSL